MEAPTNRKQSSNACILLHAALGNKTQMLTIKKALENHVFVFDFNFEGHDFEDSNPHFSLESLARQLETFIHEKDLSKPTVMGYSMGGYVALYVAARKSELLGHIVTYGTKIAWSPDFAQQELKKLNPEKIAEKVPAFAGKLAGQYGNFHWKAVVNQTAQFLLSLPSQPIHFSDIQEKFTLLLGSKDHFVAQEEMVKAAALSPHGSFRMVEGTHDIASVPPEVWLQVIRLTP